MRGAALLASAALLCFAAVSAACGGDPAPPAAESDPSGSPPAAPLQTTATAVPFLLSTPVATSTLPQPTSAADRLLGGTPNRRAATLVREELKKAGYLLPGVEVHVLRVGGTYEEILVVEIDALTAQASGAAVSPIDAEDPTLFFKALAALEFSEIANVTRVVFNLHGEDAGVRSVVTVLLPYTAITAAARGEQPPDELLTQLQFEIRREAAP